MLSLTYSWLTRNPDVEYTGNMHYYEVAPNQIIRAESSTFTYMSEIPLAIGQIVSIEVGKKKLAGIVTSEVSRPAYTTKSILNVIEQTPLPKQIVELVLWMSKYYNSPLANVIQTILPSGLQKKRREPKQAPLLVKRDRTKNVFNKEQGAAMDVFAEYESGTFLLQGVTGSGKTEIYIELAKQAIIDNRSGIILVPEIALTTQLISEFANHFDNLLVTHSKMTEANRHTVWLKSLNADKPVVVIGPRSALFMPLKDVGIIVVDEAHEPSYKQEQSPKYSALRVATMLGKFHGAKVVFGSATPSVSDRYLAERSERPIIKLLKPARAGTLAPIVTLVDMTKRENFSSNRFISKQLIEQISGTLDNKQQVLIFHNRRGSASTTLCKDCGWTALCPKCFLPLTLHGDHHHLLCHICGYRSDVPTSCPTCGSTDVIHKGIGTKLIELELKKLFPNANIARFDADNVGNDSIENRYGELYDGTIDIAIGTQIVAKGLDLPHLRLVGVIQADAGLAIPNYNTGERTFQLLSQVIGRVGRDENQTQVVVQTYQPLHPSIQFGLTQDYESYYQHALVERQRSLFPPFTHLLKLTCLYKTESAAIKNSQKLAVDLRTKLPQSVRILGPTPAFYERQNGTYRWQLILKSPKREFLIDALKLVPPKNWQSELDPTSLL